MMIFFLNDLKRSQLNQLRYFYIKMKIKFSNNNRGIFKNKINYRKSIKNRNKPKRNNVKYTV